DKRAYGQYKPIEPEQHQPIAIAEGAGLIELVNELLGKVDANLAITTAIEKTLEKNNHRRPADTSTNSNHKIVNSVEWANADKFLIDRLAEALNREPASYMRMHAMYMQIVNQYDNISVKDRIMLMTIAGQAMAIHGLELLATVKDNDYNKNA